MIKCVFCKEKLNPIDTVYGKHIYYSLEQAFYGIRTWWNLKRLAE